MRVMWDNEIDSMTITSATEDANYPMTNLQDTRLSRVYRSTDDAAEYLLFDAGAGNTINPTVICIAAHNITDGATISIQGNATDAWGGPTVDETITHDSDTMILFFTGAALRYWRLYIDDGSNPDTYLEIGRVFLGTYLSLPPIEPAPNLPLRSTTTVEESVTGQAYANKRKVYREPGFIFPVVTDAQRQSIETMFRAIEAADPVFLVVWEDNLANVGPIYCRLDQDEIPFQQSPVSGLLWETSLQFKEVF